MREPKHPPAPFGQGAASTPRQPSPGRRSLRATPRHGAHSPIAALSRATSSRLADEFRGALAGGSDNVLELALHLERYVDALSRAVRGHNRAADHGLRRSVRDWFTAWDRDVPSLVVQLSAAQDGGADAADGPTVLALGIVRAAFEDASRTVHALRATVAQAEALWPAGGSPFAPPDASGPGVGLDAVIAAVRVYSEDLEYRMVAAEQALTRIGQPADAPNAGAGDGGEIGDGSEAAGASAGPSGHPARSLRLV